MNGKGLNAARRIAIVGGGPSGLFMYKRFIESDFELHKMEIHIFESKKCLGAGMPYSREGANVEHVTNVSDHEIPDLVTSVETWIQTVPENTLHQFNIELKKFSEYKVLPRLLFGKYLSAQFDLLLRRAESMKLKTQVHLNSQVTDMVDHPGQNQVEVIVNGNTSYNYDRVIICTGHHWPLKYEGKIPGYYDSPYPPKKLAHTLNHAVALKGSSLTAIDAIRTLARSNGHFEENVNGHLCFIPAPDCTDFKIVMHSRNGLLPAVRIHLEDPLVEGLNLLTQEQIAAHMRGNDGFLSLDFVFEKNFKEIFKSKDPVFYERIEAMNLEDFVDWMMSLREKLEPFQLLRAEYVEAEKSIRAKESIHWKEMLGVLSFALNYPAKYLSAEDMLRLQKVLMPLISIVIAFVPQGSCKELMALHDAGKLELIAVGDDSKIKVEKDGGVTFQYNSHEKYYQTFIDCTGQSHFAYEEFPFQSMLKKKTVSPAFVKFHSSDCAKNAIENTAAEIVCDEAGDCYLKVPGIKINDHFQVIGKGDVANQRVYLMAVPYMGGYNPDYSGLDFCAEASLAIVKSMGAIPT
jgi:uncharacterized NAD(P)/FAD-binding protein YdhS